MQKVFHTVDHCGICLIINEWFKSYLSNRKQFVSINDHISMIIFLHVLVSMHRNIALVIPVWASKEIKQNSTQKCSFYQANHKLIPLGGGGELII